MAKKTARERADETAERLTAPAPRVAPIPDGEFLSTGCTLLNLAISGRADAGIARGHYLYYVGDSSSGKTWLSFSLLAEAARNRHFDKHRFVFDNAENGALMDVQHYFGGGVAERLEPPATEGKSKTPVYSTTVQEFYYNLTINTRRPCIYILDSMDALNDDADEEKYAAELKFHETGTGKAKIPGSMGMHKAKTNSKNINRVVQALRDSGSILVVISQTRDKINAAYAGQKTRGGGRALRFFAHVEAWTSVMGPIKKTYLGKEREVGADLKVDIQKNRVSGWEGQIYVPFLKGFGIDDTGACVDFLIDERHWGKAGKTSADEDDDAGGKFAAPEFGIEGKRESLIRQIEEAGDERELQLLTARVWREIIEKAAPKRKPRYS